MDKHIIRALYKSEHIGEGGIHDQFTTNEIADIVIEDTDVALENLITWVAGLLGSAFDITEADVQRYLQEIVNGTRKYGDD